MIEFKCFDPADDWHREIEKCKVKAPVLERIQRLFAIVHYRDVMTAAF